MVLSINPMQFYPDTKKMLAKGSDSMPVQSDDDLLAELKKRFDQNRQALYDLKMTTRKLEEVNQKLQESEAIKSHFLSNIKNEINNPLTSILGLAQQLASKSNLSQEMIVAISDMVYNEAFNLDFHLRNIFAAAELESGDIAVNVSLVDISSLVRSTIDSFTHRIAEKNLQVEIQTETQNNNILFKTDSQKLALVLTNLIANAITFSHASGKVVIALHKEEGHLHVAVTDYGIGIDPKHRSRIFDRFVQLDRGLTKQFGGQGLGLSITKAIIDLMEGEITVTSSPNQGSIFALFIPEVETNIEADSFSVDGNEFFFDDNGLEAF